MKFTVLFCKYGILDVEASNREDAIRIANSMKGNIKWDINDDADAIGAEVIPCEDEIAV